MKEDAIQHRVLFVCMGNICRSPTGEGVLKKKVRDHACEQAFEIDSAGTTAYHVGQPADRRMQAAARKRGYRLDSVARAFVPTDFERFDLILAMDRDNYADILAHDPQNTYVDRVQLFCNYVSENVKDVPDPYYGGDEGFERVLDLVEEGCEAIFKQLHTRG